MEMKWLDRVLGPDEVFSLEDRSLNAVLFCSTFFGSLAFFWDLVALPETPFMFVSSSALMSFAILYALGRHKPNSKLLTIPYFIIYTIALIFVWYMTGGITGMSLVYFITLLIIVPVFVQPKRRILAFSALFALAFGLLLFELMYPALIQNYVKKDFQIMDTFMSGVFVSISAVTLMMLVRFSYEKQKKKTEAISKAKDKFYSIIAHDLRGPMASVKQLGQMLLDQHNELDPENRQELIRHIYNCSNETHYLLENLLQWAKSEREDIPVNPVPLRLGKCVNKTTKVLMESIRQKRIKLKIDIPDDHMVYADENMVMTVIRNLISNAIKFTGDDGRIGISSKKLDNNMMQFTISDSGTGIAESRQTNLFDHHVTESTKGTNNELGSGLGLNLCQEFIKKNKGDITLESQINRGATFFVTLPSFPA
jgi:signal transduction histidine kinase